VTSTVPFLKSLFPPAFHHRILLVGGTVRDMLLDKKSQDIDLVAALSDAELRGLGFRLVATTSGATLYFKHHPEFGTIEVTRIDRLGELKDDLLRRDFTVNAMALELGGAFIDPLCGEHDVHERVLRTCSAHTFSADPLRLFRAFRFEADGWTLSPETAELIRVGDWSNMCAALPVERFSNEMLKALSGKTPERFFRRMIEFSVGREMLPELFRMPSIPAGPVEHHPEGDLFVHSTQVLQRVAALSQDPLARFCAFFHDLGKLATAPALYPKHHGHDNAGFSMAVDFCNRLCLSTEHRKALAWVSALHGTANLWKSLRDATKVAMAEQAIKGGIVKILPLVSAADKPDGLPMCGWDDVVRVAGMNTRELGIDLERLEVMAVMNRPTYILQKRVELLRSLRGAANSNQ
jgi:tRNA nucleotidyltransferase (CCA-adding enzyme)